MHLLKAEKITHYFGGLCALSDFELNLRRGELVGIIGPNGAGKTTAFNLITGFTGRMPGSFFSRGSISPGRPRMRGQSWALRARSRTFAFSRN